MTLPSQEAKIEGIMTLRFAPPAVSFQKIKKREREKISVKMFFSGIRSESLSVCPRAKRMQAKGSFQHYFSLTAFWIGCLFEED